VPVDKWIDFEVAFLCRIVNDAFETCKTEKLSAKVCFNYLLNE